MKKHLIISSLGLLAMATVASAQSYAFGTDLYIGSQGSDVAALQTYLIAHGFHIPAIESGAQAKGYYGTQTASAVANYQNSVGIKPTGYFGPQTRAYLNSQGTIGGGSNNAGSNIQVVSPNGGEVWQKGTTQTIRWNSTTAPYYGGGAVVQLGTIKLAYPTPLCAQPGQVIKCMVLTRAPLTIAENVNLNAGSYQWLVGVYKNPSGIATADCGPFYSTTGQCISSSNIISDGQYQVLICSADGSACDSSDNTFTVASNNSGYPTNPPTGTAPIITGIDAPTSLNINQLGTWLVHASDPQNGYLSYSVDWGDSLVCPSGSVCNPANTLPAQTFVQQTSFTHSYSTAGLYTVKFTVRNASGLTAQSNTVVRVANGVSNGAGPLQITSPNGGEIWQKGTTHNITWTSPYYFAAAYADLKIMQTNTCTTQVCPMYALAPYTIATNISINQNSYTWNVGSVTSLSGIPQTLPDGQYSIQICQSGTSNCDSSNGTFIVTSSIVTNPASSIVVTSPNGGEVWAANSIHPIAWSFPNGGYYSGAVDIYLGQNVIPPCIAIYPAPASCAGTFQTSYTLDRNVSSNTAYNWVVGTDINNHVIPAGNYSLEVCPAGSTTGCDVSNSSFTITGTAYPYNLNQTYNQGTYYTAPTYGTGSSGTGYGSASGCPAGYICTPVANTGANYSY